MYFFLWQKDFQINSDIKSRYIQKTTSLNIQEQVFVMRNNKILKI